MSVKKTVREIVRRRECQTECKKDRIGEIVRRRECYIEYKKEPTVRNVFNGNILIF